VCEEEECVCVCDTFCFFFTGVAFGETVSLSGCFLFGMLFICY